MLNAKILGNLVLTKRETVLKTANIDDKAKTSLRNLPLQKTLLLGGQCIPALEESNTRIKQQAQNQWQPPRLEPAQSRGRGRGRGYRPPPPPPPPAAPRPAFRGSTRGNSFPRGRPQRGSSNYRGRGQGRGYNPPASYNRQY